MQIIYLLQIADTIIFKLIIPLSDSLHQRLRQCGKDIVLRIGDEIENSSLFYNILGLPVHIFTFPIYS